MRIIAGAKRGMKLLGPKTDVSRPITDRVKESLFSVLYKYGLPQGKIAADLFCGVGSLGLEALSRGAEYVTFVERDPKIITILEKNIEKAGFTGEYKVIRADAFKTGAPPLRNTLRWVEERKYDLIFVDPPYSTTKKTTKDSPLNELSVLLGEQSTEDGIVVVRTDKRTELSERYSCFQTIERRQWGTMRVTILQRSRDPALREPKSK